MLFRIARGATRNLIVSPTTLTNLFLCLFSAINISWRTKGLVSQRSHQLATLRICQASARVSNLMTRSILWRKSRTWSSPMVLSTRAKSNNTSVQIAFRSNTAMVPKSTKMDQDMKVNGEMASPPDQVPSTTPTEMSTKVNSRTVSSMDTANSSIREVY